MKRKIAVVAHVPAGIRYFLVNHIQAFSKKYDVTVISNMTSQNDRLDLLPDNVTKIDLPIARQISLYTDIIVLVKLIHLFYNEKYNIIYSITPKGGLLAMIAGWCTCVPIRIHTFTGQVWVNFKGIYKYILKMTDRITANLATISIVDSPSQREFLLKNNIIKNYKSTVLGHGSISGVDLNRFYPNPLARKIVRQELNVNDSIIVFLFVGRLKKDKGVVELTKAFSRLCLSMKNINLWFVGTDEENLQKKLESICSGKMCNIRFIPFTAQPEKYMAAADVLCLPSYREGFGSAVIEAAACGIPAIGSRIYGLTDAIIDYKTGLLITRNNIKLLELAMKKMANNKAFTNNMGKNARQRVIVKFRHECITNKLMKLINLQIGKTE